MDRGNRGESPKPAMTVLGEVVKARRIYLKLSVRKAGELSGVSGATISRVEHGELPDIPTFSKLCTWLELPPEAFLDENGLKEPRPLRCVTRVSRAS